MNNTLNLQLEELSGKITKAVAKIEALEQENQELRERNQKLSHIEEEWESKIRDLIQQFERIEHHQEPAHEPTHEHHNYSHHQHDHHS